MKKVVFVFSLLCLSSIVCVFATNPVSVISGDVSIFTKASKTLLEIDYSSMKVGNETLDEYSQRRGEDFDRDWQGTSSFAASYFVKYFNKQFKKGMQLTENSSNVDYKMKIRVDSLHFGAFNSAGAVMSGTIEMVDLKTDEVITILNVSDCKGIAVLGPVRARLIRVYYELSDGIRALNPKK